MKPRGMLVATSNLDPRIWTGDLSQTLHPLIFDNLMELDEHLRVVPRLADFLFLKDVALLAPTAH